MKITIKISTTILLFLCCTYVYTQEKNEENRIKQQDSVYRLPDRSFELKGTMEQFFRPIHPDYTLATTPIFVGQDPRLEGFGDSKYDVGLTYSQLDRRTLEDVREGRKNEELIINGICLIGLIIFIVYAIKKL